MEFCIALKTMVYNLVWTLLMDQVFCFEGETKIMLTTNFEHESLAFWGFRLPLSFVRCLLVSIIWILNVITNGLIFRWQSFVKT